MYTINFKDCHTNSLLNIKKEKGNKIRAGVIKYNNKIFDGDKSDLTVRAAYIPACHSWVETKDGFIIDWAINYIVSNIIGTDPKNQTWTKDTLKNMGIEYVYYDNETKILNKIKRRFKSHIDAIEKNGKKYYL